MTKTISMNSKPPKWAVAFEAIVRWIKRMMLLPKAFFILLTFRRFGIVAVSKPKKNKYDKMVVETVTSNNLDGSMIFLVPMTPRGVSQSIKRLESLRKDLIHINKNHKGVSLRNLEK